MNHRFSITFIVALAVGLLLTDVTAEPQISTIAGTGESGYTGDGKAALEAKLNQPFGVIVGLDGDIYYCDTENHVIRRILRKNGVIETVVGTGEEGYSGDGGAPLEAKLNEPYEVRFHPSGDLYWVERLSHTVRRWDAITNTVSTVAGTGEAGFSGDGGAGNKAQMKQPHSIQFDASGDALFICDIGNHRIRRLDIKTGTIETWCGTGEAKATPDGSKVSTETPLKGPRALDRAPDGDLWLALREGNQVFRIDMKSETLHHVAGTGKGGFHAETRNALDSQLSGPKGVAISPDGKLVYLADTESHTVRAIDLSVTPPVLKLIAGDGRKGDGPDSPDPLKCRMDRLHGVGVDSISGDIYIGDSQTHKVRKVTGLPGAPRAPLSAYETVDFKVDGRACKLAKPKKAAPGNPWIWRCRFFGAFPAVDEGLLADGWHVATIDVSNLFGAPEAMEAFDIFYKHMTGEKGLHAKPVIEGFSRGGLPATLWPMQNPDKVSGIYLDAPVLNIHTWPRRTSPGTWPVCMKAWGLTEETADSWVGPLTQLEKLAKANVPILLIAGGGDDVVPFSENGGVLVERFRALGGDLTLTVKAGCGHHPHSLHDPAPAIAWVKRVIK
ncbi:prolyl oligopeptidase family serine peptidase [Verrucomicrobiales bacterium BCK34]|nr:prolyl oligopeptidase family serine peptidase [Verrucomicrobiales bacterium BCK34]